MSFQDPSRGEILAMAKACGIEHQQLTSTMCRLRMAAEGTVDVAETTFDSTMRLVLQSIHAGRQSGIRALRAPLVMTDDEIDQVLTAALGAWGRQARWLELVGRPVAQAVIAHLNAAWSERMGTAEEGA
jgi:hypothetical protein